MRLAMVLVSLLVVGMVAQDAAAAPAPTCARSEVVPQSVRFRSSPLSPLNLGRLTVDATTTDDLLMSPRRQRLLGQGQPNIVNFFWAQPVFKSQPRDSWGQPIVTSPDEPRLAFLDVWSPALGVHVGNWFGVPEATDVFAAPRVLEHGYVGPIKSRVVEGDPTGLSCDARTVEDRAVGRSLPKYNFSTQGAKVVRDGWNLTWRWFPYSSFFVPSGATQFGYAEGTYRGKPIEMVGAFDRYYGLPVAYAAVLAKRVLNVFAARGVDGTFEYGLVIGVKDVVNRERGGWAFGGVYCKDGEGCAVSNRVELKNVTWGRGATPPHKVLPVEGTYAFGGKEISFKATGGMNLSRVKNSGPVLPLVSLITEPTRWGDAMSIWREKRSPRFDLSFSGVETYGLTLGDIAELEAMGRS